MKLVLTINPNMRYITVKVVSKNDGRDDDMNSILDLHQQANIHLDTIICDFK